MEGAGADLSEASRIITMSLTRVLGRAERVSRRGHRAWVGAGGCDNCAPVRRRGADLSGAGRIITMSLTRVFGVRCTVEGMRATLFLLTVAGLFAADWPQFRGPGAAGIADGVRFPERWSETENVAWKTAIPGVDRKSTRLNSSHT